MSEITKIIVGSANPVKIEATRQAFKSYGTFGRYLIVDGVEVDSGIGCQPLNDQEAMTGAVNRAFEALSKSLSADYAVGIEGTLCRIGETDRWFDCGWICVVGIDANELPVRSFGSTIRMPLPDKFVVQILSGEYAELGDVLDAQFNMKNVKQSEGHFGLFTTSITRTTGYRDGIIAALSRFGPQAHIFEETFDSREATREA